MLSRIYSGAIVGIDAVLCEVEVDAGKASTEKNTLVGLPDAAVKESLERTRSSIINCGYPYPKMSSLINLAPAALRKEGPSFDLPIAIGLLAGQGAIESDTLHEAIIVGELALDGRTRQVKGALAIALMAREMGYRTVILPAENAREAAVVQEVEVIPVSSLTEAVGFLNGQLQLEPVQLNIESVFQVASHYDIDFSDVKGQESVKRALTVAAAGNHNIIMIGPPGTGKTMLTKRLPTVMPPLSLDESLETTRIHSAVGILQKESPLLARRPIRMPHHSASGPSLVGGGSVPKPGELSLAHNGLLFLDEFPEFKRSVLETIRQPLEDRCVTIARASGTMTFPANIMLVAAMNPCPCGYLTDVKRKCKCSPNQVENYLSRISGPLLDRIDIHVEVPAVSYRELSSEKEGTNSALMREQVETARAIQRRRFSDNGILTNSQMSSRDIRQHCKLDEAGQTMIKQAVYEMGLSARAHDKVMKIARTIADIDQCEDIASHHVAEAIQYRRLDRNL